MSALQLQMSLQMKYKLHGNYALQKDFSQLCIMEPLLDACIIECTITYAGTRQHTTKFGNVKRGSKHAEYFVNYFGLLVGPWPLRNTTSVSLDLVYKMTTLVVEDILYTFSVS